VDTETPLKKKELRRQRIYLLGVPVDVLPEDELEEAVRNLLADGASHQIIFITLMDLLRARGKSEFAKTVKESSLVIPLSKGILRGARFLRRPVPVRYMPFSFVIKLMGVLEKHHKSLYLVGSQPQRLSVSSANIRDSFPGLRIVGRYAGFFPPEREKDIVLAIRKASPSLLLVGPGVKGKNRWIRRHKDEFQAGLALWCGECFDIFCGKKKRITYKSWERGTYRFGEFLRHPWRVLRLFSYLYYLLLLLFARIRGR
jgi:N-acetylglucosaminyldiphosphoundecaprenol N-acetyl-beta-D-mannosaminyltransferase